MGNQKKHDHDVHWMLIALILGFFIMALSLNRMDPNFLTGNVVAESDNIQVEIGFKDKFQEVVNPEVSEVEIADTCRWVNLNNEDFTKIRGQSANSACQTLGFSSCIMTNTVQTTSYYSSTNSRCQNIMFEDDSNRLGNCNSVVKTVNTPCYTQTYDQQDSGYTTIYCCS